MVEQQVKNALGFLCTEYGLYYKRMDFENYLSTGLPIETYNYHNANGCFTIANFPVRGDVSYLRFDSIDMAEKQFRLYYCEENCCKEETAAFLNEKHSHEVNVFLEEPEIWKENGKLWIFNDPPFWWSTNRILKTLAQVINIQINKYGAFFGIKIR